MSPHPDDAALIELVLRGDGEPDPTVAMHLQACEPCRLRVSEVAAVLARLDAAALPERGEEYGRRVWRRLEPALPARAPRRLRWPGLAWAGAMAASIVLAFLVGRRWPADRPSPEDVRERILLVTVGDHLERSQMVLLELRSLPADEDAFVREQARADQLVRASRLYRQSAAGAGDPLVARGLEELERVLLGVARAPGSLTPGERAALRDRIEAGGVLFKVRALSAQVRERERTLRSAHSSTL